MKTFILVLLFAATSALAAPGDRDGLYWQSLSSAERGMWATGWIDGLCTGEVVTRDYTSFHSEIFKFNGMTNGEVVAGLDQFYAADYRNLAIWMPEAALFVSRYARAGMSSRDAAAQILALREKYNGAH